MTLPDGGDEPFLYREEPEWGVSRDSEPPPRSPASRLIWIILTILIILSLVLPWILPYLFPRRVPLRDGLQAMGNSDIPTVLCTVGISEFPPLNG